ncbi:putative exodeoxyribonuclease V, alpha subunit [Dorcoceras hygrometricum]|uniref:Putative exodeoxyribonuclease V, alpha subunit n=1 Tax=Dorcoceras hygrometricum TaxID=472368 RepID=A0A2Z7BZB7_9LAMI|nr:putative exodeoxyribonuclease V, alpha subunit [Dorcoceras hygrometricum]
MATCARATSRIACDIIACWSRDGRLLDALWSRDCGTLAGRWGSADCANVERCCAAGRASRPIVGRCSMHGGALLEEGLREEAAGRYVRRSWRDSARRNMVAAAAVRRVSGDVVTADFF